MNRHATLTAELAELSPLQQAAAVRQTAAQAAADKIAQLTEQVKEAELIAAAATATSTSSQGAHTERQRLRAETDTRAATVAALEAEAHQAAEAQATAQEVTVAADAVVDRGRPAPRRRPAASRDRPPQSSTSWPAATRPTDWQPGSPRSTPPSATVT